MFSVDSGPEILAVAVNGSGCEGSGGSEGFNGGDEGEMSALLVREA